MKEMQAALELNHNVLEDSGNSNQSLLDLVRRYQRNEILLPKHQRQFIWPEWKITGWIDRLRSKVRPVGVILTYQKDEDGKGSPVYLNDGSQRIRATEYYLLNHDVFGDSLEMAERYVRACHMPTQHRIYETDDDALIDFQDVNLGTHLTTYEMCHGIISYMDGYDIHWEPLLNKLHNVVRGSANRIVAKLSKKRETEHKHLRHDYSLLYRFLSRDKTRSQYNISGKTVRSDELKKRKVIEWKLRLKLDELGPKSALSEAERLFKLIERETSLFVDVWHKQLEKDPGIGIAETLYRFLLSAAVWKMNNSAGHTEWEKLVHDLLKANGGKSYFLVPDGDDGHKKQYSMGISNGLSHLASVCASLGSTFVADIDNKAGNRRNAISNLKPGSQNSHLLPFRDYGDGAVIPEPGGRNMSRGATPIDAEL